ncbi:GNAT family N-acetyltransferase [Anabaena sp. CCY 9910]|uniref:GNAT family N-acetyltransferase n=1 Tax=Anabaena sp. CCY 9910 TaxID=3103870 RepID=UPI0039DF7C3A
MQNLTQTLQPQRWQTISQKLLAKMLSEFMYEEIIKPETIEQTPESTLYNLTLPEGIAYKFQAKKRLFDSYRVIPASIQRREAGEFSPAFNPLQFVLDIHTFVGMTAETTAHLIKELSNTLLADAHIQTKKETQNIDLLSLDYPSLEGEMEGHPWITFNKGRIGFGYDDYLAHAPESKQPVSLFWIAVSSEHAQFNAIPGLDYVTLIQEELGAESLAEFTAILEQRHLNPADYYFLPVHDWQWKNIITLLFVEEIATGAIIPLGYSQDKYLPQQSIRTFANISHPQKRYVKLPLSILNTLVYRGLPGDRTQVAPLVTEYVKSICDNDPFLKNECRLILPGEIASVNYDHPYYSQLAGAPYQYKEMLGCLWRESVLVYTEADERPITLASLLHIDGSGKPFISQLVERSGLSLDEWLSRLFNTILPPLLHYLYRYGVVFSPHGENTILVLKDFVPHRLAMKDFVDDVNISRHPLPELETLTPQLKAVLLTEPPEGLCQFIFAGLFICHHRYLSDLLADYHNYPEHTFWTKVRQTILNYQSRFPEMQDRFELFNLLAPQFTKLCLNRNRLITYGYADDGDRPHAAAFGKVNNALYLVDQKAKYLSVNSQEKQVNHSQSSCIFTYIDPEYGKEVSFRPVSYEQDVEMIYDWMQQKHLIPFWKLNISFAEFQEYLQKSLTADHKKLFIGSLDGEPVSYGIIYQVIKDNIRHYYPYQESDMGGHIAIGKREHFDKEYIFPIFRGSSALVFHLYKTERLIIEPDSRNRIVIPTQEQCGFYIYDEVKLPHKKATLMILEREKFFQNLSNLKQVSTGFCNVK